MKDLEYITIREAVKLVLKGRADLLEGTAQLRMPHGDMIYFYRLVRNEQGKVYYRQYLKILGSDYI